MDNSTGSKCLECVIKNVELENLRDELLTLLRRRVKTLEDNIEQPKKQNPSTPSLVKEEGDDNKNFARIQQEVNSGDKLPVLKQQAEALADLIQDEGQMLSIIQHIKTILDMRTGDDAQTDIQVDQSNISPVSTSTVEKIPEENPEDHPVEIEAGGDVTGNDEKVDEVSHMDITTTTTTTSEAIPDVQPDDEVNEHKRAAPSNPDESDPDEQLDTKRIKKDYHDESTIIIEDSTTPISNKIIESEPKKEQVTTKVIEEITLLDSQDWDDQDQVNSFMGSLESILIDHAYSVPTNKNINGSQNGSNYQDFHYLADFPSSSPSSRPGPSSYSQSIIRQQEREALNKLLSGTIDLDHSSPSTINSNDLFSISTTTTTCTFCAMEFSPQVSIVLRACQHIFCSDCLQKRITSSTGTQIPCPIECGQFLDPKEIKALLSESQYELYEKNVLDDLPIFRCKTRGCGGSCVFESQGNIFLCPECNKQNCFQCNAAHDGISCEEYKQLRSEADRSGTIVTDEELIEKAAGANFGVQEMTKLFGGYLQDVPKDNLALFYDKAGQLLENLKVVETGAEFECIICTRMNKSEAGGHGIILSSCSHNFCRDCLQTIIGNSEKIPIPCPFVDNDGLPCKEFLTASEFKALAPEDVYQKHIRWGFSMAADVLANKFQCLRPSCEGFWEIDDEDQMNVYICPVCAQHNCVGCNAIHMNVTCENYQESLRRELVSQPGGSSEAQARRRDEEASERELNRMLSDRTFMRCPYCQFVCEKISGCDHVVCLNRACKQPFNFHGKNKIRARGQGAQRRPRARATSAVQRANLAMLQQAQAQANMMAARGHSSGYQRGQPATMRGQPSALSQRSTTTTASQRGQTSSVGRGQTMWSQPAAGASQRGQTAAMSQRGGRSIRTRGNYY